ncbi:MAG: helix-turn-helix domain-containing protein [Pyrinomonadaceae bacterium]
MSDRLTTAQAAERLNVSQPTVKLWCRQGRFPGAVLVQTKRGPVWMIPESDLKDFEPPKMIRPSTTSNAAGKAAAGRVRASDGAFTGKRRGGQRKSG